MNQNQLISPLPDIPVRIYEVPETEKSGLFDYSVKQQVTRGKIKWYEPQSKLWTQKTVQAPGN
jgi:hypothetical protein